MIIYNKQNSIAEGAIGRYDTPIRMYIENESDLMKKKGGIRDWLFNVEKSTHFAETVIFQSGFNIFEHVKEGEGAPSDNVGEIGSSVIEHIQFMKEFTISAEMMEDAKVGIAANAKRRIQNFVRSYYNTINKACACALINGTQNSMKFGGGNFYLHTPDSEPLFSNNHQPDPVNGGEIFQSNYFTGEFAKSGGTYDIGKLSESLYTLANKIRGMKDEHGDPTGYIADTVILPGNKPTLELMIKKICGSENVVGSADNDINIHYGRWNVIILPNWNPDTDEMMVMSSEANTALAGNIFYERVPLTVTPWVDHHTGNYNWTGRCRFGIGFSNYKHIARVVDGEAPKSTDLYE